MLKTFLAFVGAVVLTLYVLGALEVGHFVLRYGPTKIVCTP